jgi:hypothetical protein
MPGKTFASVEEAGDDACRDAVERRERKRERDEPF